MILISSAEMGLATSTRVIAHIKTQSLNGDGKAHVIRRTRKYWVTALIIGVLYLLGCGTVWNVTCDVIALLWETGEEATEAVTRDERIEQANGPILNTTEVWVRFAPNPEYNGWGELLAGPSGHAELGGRVYAANYLNGERVAFQSVKLGPETRGPSDGRTIEWRNVRVPIGARSSQVCVEIDEQTRRWNVLGTIQDVLHLVEWDDEPISTGNQLVAAACVDVMRYRQDGVGQLARPYNGLWGSSIRTGESVSTGVLELRWEGPNG